MLVIIVGILSAGLEVLNRKVHALEHAKPAEFQRLQNRVTVLEERQIRPRNLKVRILRSNVVYVELPSDA